MEKNNQFRTKLKTLFSDTLAFTISNFASKILCFLLIPLYTSVLSTEEYGIADLITNTVNVLYPILTLSIMEATLRFAFDSKLSKQEVLVNSLLVVIISEWIVILLFPVVRAVSTSMADYWLWFSVIFLGNNLQQVLSQYVKGIGKTRIYALSGVIQTIVLIASNIIGLLLLDLGLPAYLFSIAAGYYLNCVFLVAAAKIRIRKCKLNYALLKEMLRFSIPTIPTLVAWWVSTSADKYIIIAYLGIAASGVYSVAYKIPSILTIFTNIFTSAWTLSAIRNVDDEDNSHFHTVIYQYFNIINVLACSVLIMLAKPLAKILFSNDFYSAWQYVPLLLLAYVFSGLSGFLASSFRAAKYTKGLFGSTVIGAVTNIILNFIFIKYFGNMGAAFTTMVGFAVTFYIRSHSVRKVVEMKMDIKKDSIVYILLFVQAVVISFEISFSYVIGAVIFTLIVFAYRAPMKAILKKGYSMLASKSSESRGM